MGYVQGQVRKRTVSGNAIPPAVLFTLYIIILPAADNGTLGRGLTVCPDSQSKRYVSLMS